MYCEYWNLQKAPFDNVPDPSMYTNSHTSMEHVIAETIYAIKEANEAFAVIIGAAGSGKTLSLRMIMDAIEADKFKVVNVTNPEVPFTQLLKEIIRQLSDTPCEENRKAVLLEIFRCLLKTAMNRKQRVAIFIDEANAISPANLENLRLLMNMQDERTILFTLVLAGQMELAQRLEHPKRANLFQRIASYSRIDKLSSPEAVKTYIEDRLKLAGTTTRIFSDECIPVIWEYSEYGIPRLINKICKLSLKDGQTGNLDYIPAEVVTEVAERFQKLSKTAMQKRKSRCRPKDDEITDVDLTGDELEKTATRSVITIPEQPDGSMPSMTAKDDLEVAQSLSLKDSTDADYSENASFEIESYQKMVNADQPDSRHVSPLVEFTDSQGPDSGQTITQPENEIPQERDSEPAAISARTIPGKEISVESLKTVADEATENESLSGLSENVRTQESKTGSGPTAIQAVKNNSAEENETGDEIIIGEHRIVLDIPQDILKQVKSFNRESAYKSAGFWAAQLIKKHPQLTNSPLSDPVQVWNEIKNKILKRIAL